MAQNKVTSQDLSLHKSSKDAWVAINGKVYNVSSYLNEHPGGEEILIDVAGGDATAAFEDVGHSADAHEAMETLFVGNLVGYVAPTTKFVFAPKQISKTSIASNSRVKFNKSIIKNLALMCATAAGGAAAWSKISSLHRTWSASSIVPASTYPVQLGINAVALMSITALFTLAYKFKKTLDLDYQVEHYKPYLKSKRLLYGPPRCRPRPPALHPSTFNNFRLLSKRQLSHNTYCFTFALPHTSDSLELPIGRHVIIQAEIDGKMVSRSYTPTSTNSDLGKMELTVKIYPNGAIGNFLLNLPLQQFIKIRGPAGRFAYNRFACDKIICIAGGSGITPMLQVIRAICEDPADETIVNLLYANQTEEDILLREELERFSTYYPCQFSAQFFLDRPPEGWNGGKGFISPENIKRYLPAPGDEEVKVLICGPPLMVKAMRNNMVSLGFPDPGPVPKPDEKVYIF